MMLCQFDLLWGYFHGFADFDSNDVLCLTNQRDTNYLTQRIHTETDIESTYRQALLYDEAPAKITIKQF